MKTLGVFSTSRAEFGLLSNLIEQIRDDDELDYILFIGGSHHLQSQGFTRNELFEKHFKVVEFDFMNEKDSNTGLMRSFSKEINILADLFTNYKFDFTVLLGDRIELIPIVQASIVFRKPIVHLHGGEITEGAWDEQIRHMITKAAHVHFCASEEYQKNILYMGEESWRVHNVGALGVDAIRKAPNIPKADLFQKFDLDFKKPTIIMTYHPVTLETVLSEEEQISNIFSALDRYEFQLVITAPNIDVGHKQLFRIIENNVKLNKDYHFIRSLGIHNYQAILKHVEFVIGNSSSGIIEVPYFKIPTINIGDRQKGRIKHNSIVDSDYSIEGIRKAINKAMDIDFRNSLLSLHYKFGDGHASEKIVKVIKDIKIDQRLLRKRLEFHNV